MSERTAIVVGARGVVGSNLIDHLLITGGWNVIGMSRRGGPSAPGLRHVAVDLTNRDATRAVTGELAAATHVFYAAYQDRPTWAELVEPNLTMLSNVLDAVAGVPALEHVSLMQGYKVYGAHLGPFKTQPARMTRRTSRRSSTSINNSCSNTPSPIMVGRGQPSGHQSSAGLRSATR